MQAQQTITLPHEFKARAYQRPFFEAMRTQKRAMIVWHRRAGKEKTCFNFMVMQACKRVGTYFYFFPSFAQGRKILWQGMDKEGKRFIHHVPPELLAGDPNNTQMLLRFRNGSVIQIVGTDNIDSIVGTNPVGCVFSEYSLQNPKAWELIRPIMAENGGWAVFNCTPRGQNHAKELFDMAQRNPDWFCELLTVKETGIVSEEDIDTERRAGMSEDFIQQEFYCSWVMGIEGSYYNRYMQQARDEDRIGYVPWAPGSRVHVAMDIGYGDSTAIVFYQIVGNEIRVIDYYENSGEGMPHYIKVMQSKPYVYGAYYAPHDADAHQVATGLSPREVASSLGITLTILPTLRTSIDSGIECVRGLFPRMYFDESHCARLLKALENYRKEWDERHMVYKTRPRHDWASHPADAMRYLAMAVKLYVDGAKAGPTDADVEALMDKYQPRFY